MSARAIAIHGNEMSGERRANLEIKSECPALIYICAGKTGLMTLTFCGRSTAHVPVVMTLTFGGRSIAHAPVVARSELAPFHTWLNHNRYITPPRLLVPGSKGLDKIKLWKTKNKSKKYNKKIK